MDETITVQPSVNNSIAGLHRKAPGSVGDLMDFHVVKEDRERGEYTLCCKTEPWMRNALGTLHGGMCATAVDQAMGFVAYSYMAGKGTAPTIQMTINYHRPIVPGADVMVEVKVASMTRSLITMTFEAYQADRPGKLCMSGSATSFLKMAKE